METFTQLVAWKMLLHTSELLEGIPYERPEESWEAEALALWSTIRPSLTDVERDLGTTIFLTLVDLCKDVYSQAERVQAEAQQTEQPETKQPEAEQEEQEIIKSPQELTIERLLSAPQVEQRTAEWYEESLQILSGSQYATIFKTPRTRGHLVLEKAGLVKREFTPKNVVYTEDISAFTWGIRFEPVVKAIYEDMTQSTVKDLGRLRHSTNPKLGASPDGLVTTGERMGRFTEFKAPVSRGIQQEKIPEDYWIQMQIQMEVGDVEECDYFEVQLVSRYKQPYVPPTNEPQYKGRVYLVRTAVPRTYVHYETGEQVTDEGEVLRYEYSPVNPEDSWAPQLGEKDEIAEVIPWHMETYQLKTVKRDREWYQTKGIPAEATFWTDVEAAKAGTWTLPESSRKATVKKDKYDFVDDS